MDDSPIYWNGLNNPLISYLYSSASKLRSYISYWYSYIKSSRCLVYISIVYTYEWIHWITQCTLDNTTTPSLSLSSSYNSYFLWSLNYNKSNDAYPPISYICYSSSSNNTIHNYSLPVLTLNSCASSFHTGVALNFILLLAYYSSHPNMKYNYEYPGNCTSASISVILTLLYRDIL